jgi:hypothetical protein
VYGEHLNESVTHSLTEKSNSHKGVGRDIKVPVDIKVPPKKQLVISMTDSKKSIALPMTITAVLKAELHEQIRALAGNVARDTKLRDSADTDVDKRTVTAEGSLYYKASNHIVHVTASEKSAVCPEMTW